jgi:hypothetical protein
MMVKHKYDYDVGSIFCVPLRDGGYATGIVARCDHKGLAFGYFFGPRLESIPESIALRDLSAEKAVLIGQFGDIGLKKGEWRLVGSIDQWNPDAWPMPAFCSPDDDEKMVTITYYDDRTLDTKSVSTVPRSEETAKLPVDRVMGYGAVEIRLTRLLKTQ